jgi:hypothetical protein
MQFFVRPFPVVLAGLLVGCSAFVAAELDSKPEPTAEVPAEAGSSDAPAVVPDQLATPCQHCTAERCCFGECVELATDILHCGACGERCGAGRSCIAGGCQSGWVGTSSVAQPSGRAQACGLWTGSHVLVWGGVRLEANEALGDGALYDPIADSWQPMDGSNAPSPRAMPVCAWTGAELIVWGGLEPVSGTLLDGGGRWSPTAGWSPISGNNKPAGRVNPSLVWTGDKLLMWGGEKTDGVGERTGATYDPQTDTWAPMDDEDAPTHVIGSSAWWADGRMLVFGGRREGNEATNTLRSYDPATDTWVQLAASGAPSSRSHAFGAWTEKGFVLWGGWNKDKIPLSDAFLLSVNLKSWSKLEVGERPSARASIPFASGWSALGDGRLFLLGGIGAAAGVQLNGGLFDLELSTWSLLASWTPAREHRHGVGVWTGKEFFLWGGYDGSTAILGGGRWKP